MEGTFGATHRVPAYGMHAWTEPDAGTDPVATLAPGTPLQMLETKGAWAHVGAENGWRGWVDARQLVWADAFVASTVPAGTNGFAVASLVLGILWLWWLGSVLALIFGYTALAQIGRSQGRQSGRGMAIAGVVLGWIGVALLVVGLVALALDEGSL